MQCRRVKGGALELDEAKGGALEPDEGEGGKGGALGLYRISWEGEGVKGGYLPGVLYDTKRPAWI
jgi:hypothetical protein